MLLSLTLILASTLFLSELSSLSDDWEKDFDDIEVTEEDVAAATAILASTSADAEDDPDDDWENWD